MKNTEPPTLTQLQRLCDLCSEAEWQRLVTAPDFLACFQRSLGETEAIMSEKLGRTISLSNPSVKNPGDDQL